jgi:hypothetical protein
MIKIRIGYWNPISFEIVSCVTFSRCKRPFVISFSLSWIDVVCVPHLWIYVYILFAVYRSVGRFSGGSFCSCRPCLFTSLFASMSVVLSSSICCPVWSLFHVLYSECFYWFARMISNIHTRNWRQRGKGRRRTLRNEQIGLITVEGSHQNSMTELCIDRQQER